MGDDKRKKLDILRDMHQTADEVWRLTAALQLTGQAEREEAEADAYAALLAKREPLIQRLTDLKNQADRSVANGQKALCEETQKATETLVANIIKLDRQHHATMQKMLSAVKNSIKGINDVKRLSHAYAAPLGDYALLDTKK